MSSRSAVCGLIGAVGCMVLGLGGVDAASVSRSKGTADSTVVFSFFAADTNHDEVITRAEYARDIAAAFARLDVDRDLKLSPAELEPHATLRFATIDTDGSGTLTFGEVMTAKLQDFGAMDKNGDGVLTLSEVLSFTPHAWEAAR